MLVDCFVGLYKYRSNKLKNGRLISIKVIDYFMYSIISKKVSDSEKLYTLY